MLQQPFKSSWPGTLYLLDMILKVKKNKKIKKVPRELGVRREAEYGTTIIYDGWLGAAPANSFHWFLPDYSRKHQVGCYFLQTVHHSISLGRQCEDIIALNTHECRTIATVNNVLEQLISSFKHIGISSRTQFFLTSKLDLPRLVTWASNICRCYCQKAKSSPNLGACFVYSMASFSCSKHYHHQEYSIQSFLHTVSYVKNLRLLVWDCHVRCAGSQSSNWSTFGNGDVCSHGTSHGWYRPWSRGGCCYRHHNRTEGSIRSAIKEL